MGAGSDDRWQVVNLGDRDERLDVVNEVRGVCVWTPFARPSGGRRRGPQRFRRSDDHMSRSFPFSEQGSLHTRDSLGRCLSARWIKEDVEGVDAPSKCATSVPVTARGHLAVRLASAACHTVMTDCGPIALKANCGGKCDKSASTARLMAACPFASGPVRTALRRWRRVPRWLWSGGGVALAEYPCEVRLHHAVVIERCGGHFSDLRGRCKVKLRDSRRPRAHTCP
jgi:hypothetical protein